MVIDLSSSFTLNIGCDRVDRFTRLTASWERGWAIPGQVETIPNFWPYVPRFNGGLAGNKPGLVGFLFMML